MPNPGAFRGLRKEFLMGERDAYARGVAGGYAAEALSIIQRRYFKRFPTELPDEVEPSAEHLSGVDDDAPDPEITPPDETTMTAEEFGAAILAIEVRQQRVTFKKAQIKRWLIYQHVKENDVKPKSTDAAKNPYAYILAKLLGQDLAKPRMKTAVNHWRKEHRAEIEEDAKSRSEKNGLQKADQAALRDLVARERFSMLSEDERNRWTKIAEERHAEALNAWKKEVERGVSSRPADRQRAIQGIVHFAQPFLDAICEATGWKATLMVGGPEPAQGGCLNVISVHSGTTTGDVKMTFGRSERVDIKKYTIPIFGKFLQKCYSPEECRARALPEDDDLLPISIADFNLDEATVHYVHSRPSDTHPIISAASNSQGRSSEHRDVTPVAPLARSMHSRPTTVVPHVAPVAPVAPVARSTRSRPTTVVPPIAPVAPTAISRPTAEPTETEEAAITDIPVTSRSPSLDRNPFPYDVSIMLNDAPMHHLPSILQVPPAAVSVSTTAPGPLSPVPSCPASPAPSRIGSPAPSHPASPAPSRLASPAASRPVSPAPSRVAPTATSLASPVNSVHPAPLQTGPVFNSAELSAAITAARHVTSGVRSIVVNAIRAPVNSLPSLDSLTTPEIVMREKETIPRSSFSASENCNPLIDVAEPPQNRRSNRIAGGVASKDIQSTPANIAPRRSKRQRDALVDTQVMVEHTVPPLKRAHVKAAPKASRPDSASAPAKRGRRKTKA